MKLSKNIKKVSLFTVAGIAVAGVFTGALLGGLSTSNDNEQSYIKISSPDKQYTIYEDDIKFKNEISTFDTTDTSADGETSMDYWYAKGLEIAFYEYTLTEIWGYDTALLSSISSFNDLFTSGWEVAASTGTMINIDEDAEDDIYIPGTASINSLESLWDSVAIATIYQDTMMSDLTYNDYIIQHSTNNPNLIIAANRDVGLSEDWATGQLAKDLPDIFSINSTGGNTAPTLASELQAMWELGLHTTTPNDGGSLYQLTSDSDLRLEILDKMLVYSFLYQEVGTNSSYDSYLTAYMYLKKPYMVWQMTYANSDTLAESAGTPNDYIPSTWDDWNSYYDGTTSSSTIEPTIESSKGKSKRFITPVGKESSTATLADDYTYGFNGIQFSSETIPNITDSDFNKDSTKYWNAWGYDQPNDVWNLGDLYDLTQPSGSEYISKPTILGNGDDRLQIPAQDGIVSAGMPIYPKPQGVGDYNSTKDTFPTYSYSTSWTAGDVQAGSTVGALEPANIWEVLGFEDDKYAQAYIISSLIDSDAAISNSAHSYWRDLGYYIELSGDFERLSSYINADILNSDEQ
ncbi:MAG: hypothetical protein HRS57_01720 [Mycoplasmataceae bacterium]|nr:hypothetical protein [Mycoplasmataceae bacterium]